MRAYLTSALMIAVLLAPPAPLRGQTAVGTVTDTVTGTVTGTVVERGSGRPLPGVRLVLRHTSADRAYRVRTDSAGRFRLDGLAAGAYRITYIHPELRSAGPLHMPRRRVPVEAGESTRLRLALPPAAVILAATCPDSTMADGAARAEAAVATGVVVGVVRAERTGTPLPGAEVSVAWVAAGTISERHVRTDGRGFFLVCGVPAGTPVRIRAAFLGRGGESVRLRVPAGGATRRDLTVPAASPGTVAGRVVAAGSGEPVAGAYVRFPEAGRAAVTSSQGRFRLEGLPAGTQPLVVKHVAYGTRRDTVRVRAGETVRLEAALRGEAIPLEGITVTVVSERRRYEMSSGTRVALLTREEIKNYPGPDGHMGYLLLDRIPGLHVSLGGSGFCIAPRATISFGFARDPGCMAPMVVLDGIQMPNNAASILSDLPLRSIESIEYLGSIEAGVRFGSRGAFGALIIWTRGLGPWAEGKP